MKRFLISFLTTFTFALFAQTPPPAPPTPPTDQKAEVGSPVCVKFVPRG